MPEMISLSAEPRPRAGKGAARATRRAGRVPGDRLRRRRRAGADQPRAARADRGAWPGPASSTIWSRSASTARRTARCRARCSTTRSPTRPLHVDFQRVAAGAQVHRRGAGRVRQPGASSPGLRRGGILNVVRHDIEMLVLGRQHPGASGGQPAPGSTSATASISARSSCRKAPARRSRSATSRSPASPPPRRCARKPPRPPPPPRSPPTEEPTAAVAAAGSCAAAARDRRRPARPAPAGTAAVREEQDC